jgi:hypothetical protein
MGRGDCFTQVEGTAGAGLLAMVTSLSRSGVTSPFGKLTASFPAWKGPEETLEGAQRLARAAGVPLSEWIRMVVMVRVHGIDAVVRMHEDQIRVVAGMDEESSRNGEGGG